MPETHSAMFWVRYLLICDHTGSSLLLRVSGLGEQGLLFIVVCGFLTAGASLVAELRLQGKWAGSCGA